MKHIIKNISILSYLLIILAGQMIGLPFFLWLIYTIFDFGNIDQLFAILGIMGIGLNYTKWKNSILVMIISFFLMLSPLISRLMQVPLEKFNYLSFLVPLIVFISTYLIFVAMKIKNFRR